MGILDSFFSDNPNDAAYMALASGLLSGKGNFNSILGNSLLGAQNAYSGATDAQMKRLLMKAQIGDIAAQEELRKQQAAKISRIDNLFNMAIGGGSPSQYGVGGSGISMGGVKEQMTPVPSGLAGASPELIAALKKEGIDISGIWETAQFGKGTPAGQYLKKPGQGLSYLPKPGEASIEANGNVFLPPGTAEATGALAGATTAAQEKNKAPYQLVTFIDDKGEQRQLPLSVILDQIKNPAPTSSNYELPGSGFTLGSNTENAIKMRQRELASANHEDAAALTREISRLQQKPMVDVRYPGGGSVPAAPSSGIKTGFSPEQVATQAANKEYQTKRAGQQATDMATIQEKGIAAPTRIATIKQLGDLYAGFEGGTLSEFAKKVASTANSLGIQIDPKLGDKEAAAAIGNKLAIELRNTGQGSGMPGSLSDSDREFLRSMTPQLAQTAAGRQKIIDSHIALANRDAQIAQFARNYEGKYGKVDNGFFTQLSEWSKANPLFK